MELVPEDSTQFRPHDHISSHTAVVFVGSLEAVLQEANEEVVAQDAGARVSNGPGLHEDQVRSKFMRQSAREGRRKHMAGSYFCVGPRGILASHERVSYGGLDSSV